MLKTKEDIAKVELEVDWSSLKCSIVRKLTETFQRHPDWFFTEHDIHSVLYNIVKEELQLDGISPVKTHDKHQVTLVHHEYPTPFRCSMKGYDFEIKHDKPYKRGHYDLVILNPVFVNNHEFDVVCAKDYQKFRIAMEKVNTSPLIWVCEVIFFPRVKTIPNSAIHLIEQDALKAQESLRHRIGSRSVRYCKMGSVLVFTGYTAEGASDLRGQVRELEERLKIEVILSTA